MVQVILNTPGGIEITKPLTEIIFYDVYEAVEKNKEALFHFHENANSACPVGRNIHSALSGELQELQRDFEDSLRRHRLSGVIGELHREIEREGFPTQ